MIKWHDIRLTDAVLYHLFVPNLCNGHFVLHAVYFIPRKNNLYILLIDLCLCCWLCACRHCCYIILCRIMCCPHNRHDCCYVYVVYCVLPLGTCGHCHSFIFVLLLHACWYCHMCGYCRRFILYAIYALLVLPYAQVLPPVNFVCYVCTAGTATCMG